MRCIIEHLAKINVTRYTCDAFEFSIYFVNFSTNLDTSILAIDELFRFFKFHVFLVSNWILRTNFIFLIFTIFSVDSSVNQRCSSECSINEPSPPICFSSSPSIVLSSEPLILPCWLSIILCRTSKYHEFFSFSSRGFPLWRNRYHPLWPVNPLHPWFF